MCGQYHAKRLVIDGLCSFSPSENSPNLDCKMFSHGSQLLLSFVVVVVVLILLPINDVLEEEEDFFPCVIFV